MKSCLKLWFFPKAVHTALTQNVLVPSQLNNPEALSDILSTSVVGKIKLLNNLATLSSLSGANPLPHTNIERSLNILNLLWTKEYSSNSAHWAPFPLPDGFISALAEDGDEALSPQIDQRLQQFYIPFAIERIGNKEYGIIFGEAIGIDSPAERTAYLKRDMETLLRTVSPDVSQREMLHEVVFDTFINLNV